MMISITQRDVAVMSDVVLFFNKIIFYTKTDNSLTIKTIFAIVI